MQKVRYFTSCFENNTSEAHKESYIALSGMMFSARWCRITVACGWDNHNLKPFRIGTHYYTSPIPPETSNMMDMWEPSLLQVLVMEIWEAVCGTGSIQFFTL
jgi:hypothetical protein